MNRKTFEVTYPKIFQNRFTWAVWRKMFCVNGFHLFDEVWSAADHYLYCDACDLSIDVKGEK